MAQPSDPSWATAYPISAILPRHRNIPTRHAGRFVPCFLTRPPLRRLIFRGTSLYKSSLSASVYPRPCRRFVLQEPTPVCRRNVQETTPVQEGTAETKQTHLRRSRVNLHLGHPNGLNATANEYGCSENNTQSSQECLHWRHWTITRTCRATKASRVRWKHKEQHREGARAINTKRQTCSRGMVLYREKR